MPNSLTVVIGYDPAEAVAFHVLVASILRYTTCAVNIIPLVQPTLRHQGIYRRASIATESTTFSFTRFLTPALCDYEGFAMYMDADFLVRCDLSELLRTAFLQPDRDLWVCQHHYTPQSTVKMGGKPQVLYPRKNWSSLMLLRCDACRMLTPEYVNTASPSDLHQLAWVADDRVGGLPLEYNWLVGEYPKNDHAKIYHYTLGIPALDDYKTCDHADLWWEQYREMLTPCQG